MQFQFNYINWKKGDVVVRIQTLQRLQDVAFSVTNKHTEYD